MPAALRVFVSYYLVEFLLTRQMFQRSTEYQNSHLILSNYFTKICLLWKNVAEPDRPQIVMLQGACAWRVGYIMLCFETLTPTVSSLCQRFGNEKAHFNVLDRTVCS